MAYPSEVSRAGYAAHIAEPVPEHVRRAIRERGTDAVLASLRQARVEEHARASEPTRIGGSDWYQNQSRLRVRELDGLISYLSLRPSAGESC